MSYNRALVKKRLQELGVQPKRSLGQNFLVGQQSVARIVSTVEKLQPKALLEVGPGLGALTEPLQKLNLPLKLIELDKSFCSYWRDHSGLEVIEGDALKVDWKELAMPVGSCLVSNLPYQISSSLVIDRSVEPAGFSSMVLMFQKEVAQRLQARPKTKHMGLLSVMAQAHWTIESVLEAGPNEFFPPPKIASRVLAFRYCKRFKGDSEQFLNFVKAGFRQRRKLLISNLKGFMQDGERLERELSVLGHSTNVRAEELSVGDWVRLFSGVREG